MRRKRRRNTQTIKPGNLLIIMIILCLAIIVLSRNGNSSGPASYAAGYVIVPMQKGINHIGKGADQFRILFKSKAQLKKENEALKEQVSQMQIRLDAATATEQELSGLQRLYEMDKTYIEYSKVAASVIAKDSGNWFSTFLINRGKRAGIEVGMNVIADGGLCGIITDVGPNYAKVRSIIDDASNVSAVDSITQDLCIVSGSLKRMNESNQIDLSDMRTLRGSHAAAGDLLTTSEISDIYLKGIPIGYIAAIETDEGNLTRSGSVVPIVDFKHLDHVFVILMQKETADDKSEKSGE